MSDEFKSDKNGPGPSKNVDSPRTQERKLKERVNFFEKVWTGIGQASGEEIGIDIGNLEQKLEEERKKHATTTHIETVILKSSPKPWLTKETHGPHVTKIQISSKEYTLEHPQREIHLGTLPSQNISQEFHKSGSQTLQTSLEQHPGSSKYTPKRSKFDETNITPTKKQEHDRKTFLQQLTPERESSLQSRGDFGVSYEHVTLRKPHGSRETSQQFLDEERRCVSPHLEHVTLRKTPLSSPKHVVEPKPWKEKAVDIAQIERRLEEERRRHLEHSKIEHVTLRHVDSPSKDGHNGKGHPGMEVSERRLPKDFEESFEKTVEEGDLSSGSKVVKFEKITVRKTTKEIIKPLGSRTPSEEHLLEDSAYHSHGNGAISKSSSISSSGRFPSEESLRRTPSRESLGKDDVDSASSSSKHTTSGSEWYQEYKHQSFLQSGTKLDYVRSRSQYDSHIAEIRGKL